MSLTVAFQMDHISTVNIAADSSFALALEAQARGMTLYHYEPKDLSMLEGRVIARAQPLSVRNNQGDHFMLGEAIGLDLATTDVVWMRQDPPFDMAYITATHILERLKGMSLVVNDPFHVRNAPEKILVTEFGDLTPPTLITRNVDAIKAFRTQHRDIIVKPLYGNGGAGVFRIKPDDENLSSLLEMFFAINREPVIVQAYLPAVRAGDKRIILVDGEPVGALNRVPPEGEARSNLHAGGRAEKVALTPRDLEICARIGPLLRERGMIFTGIDVIGGYLTEINVTSPTGIWAIRKFDGTDIAALIWDAIAKRLA
jgi:glutathione synthase